MLNSSYFWFSKVTNEFANGSSNELTNRFTRLMRYSLVIAFLLLINSVSASAQVPSLNETTDEATGEPRNEAIDDSGETIDGITDETTRSTPDDEIDNESATPDAYTLGPGDRINIQIFGAPEYSGEAVVLPDGSLNLPTAGAVLVQGMTIQQASDAIATQYSPFLRRPLVTVTLASFRPVRVGIVGEVNRPGSYTISQEEAIRFPTVTEAIELAGGITPSANLRQVQVHRRQDIGSEQVIDVDLWAMLQTGDLSKDLLLQGGDTVVIPTAEAVDPAEATQLGMASFAPDTVTVYVVGEVVSPGAVSVPQNTPLNQVLLAAGGFDGQRAETDSVELVRLNPNGTVSQREVAIDFSQGINEESNPALRNNDVIVVGRSGLANFADTAELALGPFGRILSNILGIMNIFD